MITIFHDRIHGNAGTLFQKWRQANPSGFYINKSTPSSGKIHTSHCRHLTDPALIGKALPIAVTKKPKICARTIPELQRWAKKRGIAVPICADCHPDPRSGSILSLEKYKEVLDDILSASKSVPLAEEFEGIKSPGRAFTGTSRVIREPKLGLRVKMLHEYKCQICGENIELPDGRFYVEAHHIKPLGKPHNGPDILSNLLCLCPNHHVAMDYRALPIVLKDFRKAKGHEIEEKYVDYHNSLVRKML